MKLYTEKIDAELKRLGKPRLWLARQMKRSPQIVYYWLHKRSVKGAEPIAKVLFVEPKDLIK